MKPHPRPILLFAALGTALAAGIGAPPAAAAGSLATVRVVNDGCFIPDLGTQLGFFAAEGIQLQMIRVQDYTPSRDDYDMQVPMNRGQIDIALDWFHHVMYGAGNGAPVTGVILFEHAPGIKILVANRVKDRIRSVADFGGRNLATGALFSTKTYLTKYMMRKAGLPPDGYNPVGATYEGRKDTLVKGLQEGRIDALTFMEPMTSEIEATGLVSTLYDLTTEKGTRAALGDYWPTRCVFIAPSYIAAHPDTVQQIVNGFVRTMRYVNSHSADEIAAALPARFFAGKDRAVEIDLIRKHLPGFARGDYTFSPSAVRLVADAVFVSDFDQSGEGRWRQRAKGAPRDLSRLYDNRFAAAAMKAIPQP